MSHRIGSKIQDSILSLSLYLITFIKMSSALRLSRSIASASVAKRAFTTSRVVRDHFLEADAAVS
jgi:hypothetical protein